ncbi:PAS domain-containing protein [Aurantimonas sp. MSK8Z-1]|uniref:cell cycle histidine kinase CckA n=1 Tax=Mangrovibrevibacter kandeliae TaxID=2968473 RepID=UPI002118E97D|nr:PAS domain-containing protein [Aurantimonas sp. MSK8Z-1]MCW4114414.1 PAS domain-containing protein [Aurantimonas sp. MSK8Z-1]
MANRPLVDRSASAGGIRRLLTLGGFLFLLAAGLALFGNSFGDRALLIIFGLLAVIGMLAIFAICLGLLQFAGRTGDGSIARAFVEALPVGTLIVDRKGRVIYANRAYGDITGASEAAEVRTIERLLAREPDASEAIYRLANSARDSRAGQEEFRLARAIAGSDPTPHWYRASVRPLDGDRASLQAWQIADITSEREEQETFFRDLQHAIDYLDRAPVGYLATDDEGRLIYINATLAEWVGLDLVSFRPRVQAFSDLLTQDGRTGVEKELADLAPGEIRRVEADFVTGTGQRMPVRMLCRTEASGGAPRGALRAAILKRSVGNGDGDALQAAEIRFTRFFNSSPMAIAAIDGDGRVVRANPEVARVFGAGAATGETAITEAIREANRDALRHALAAVVSGKAGTPSIDTETLGEPSRSVRLYMSPISDLPDSSGEMAIIYGVDITEQRALEDQFAKSQKMQAIGNLAGGIAHDFNNVLTIITASVDFLLLNHRTGDPSFQDLLLIKQSANRAASLVRQLLAYSRRQTMRPKMLNLTDVIADMHLLLKRVSGDHAALERQHARDLWPVMADIGQFEQVITNLVQNARDAMPDGGTITISTRNLPSAEVKGFNYPELTEGDYVLVEVADTGTGMPAEVAERIFEPFFTTKEIGKGTGLGLSMVYGIVKQSNGFIFVDTRDGEGTTFRIFLPRHVPTELAPARGDAAPPSADARTDLSGTASILLVEDEDHVRAGNVRALKMRGYEVHEASSGLEALELMQEIGETIDLVVSDVVMPEMDGPTLLTELRKDWPDLKFIFVSGYAEDAFAKNLPDGIKFGFLAKPFSLRDLALAVKSALDE